MTRPLIGITVSRSTSWWVYPLLAVAIARAGGRAVRWSHAGSLDVDSVDGIVIGAGEAPDLHLSGGGLAVRTTAQRSRDVLDRWALNVAFADAKPILALGFGVARLNAALGGRSHGAPNGTHCASAPRRSFALRRIRALSGSRLARAFGTGVLTAPAFRSSDIETLGAGLHIAARDEDGVIQAIERSRTPFALGVQWRPELAVFSARQLGIFRALVEAAGQAARDRRMARAAAGPVEKSA
jgi:putative glutamine amidotransferase